MREKDKKETLGHARRQLDKYLEMNDHRKTPERYKILEAVYCIGSHFSLDDLSAYLEEKMHFIVSRPTLYNTLRLFAQLRLIIRHNVQGKTRYEACIHGDNHIHQVCTVCGKMTEIQSSSVIQSLADIKHNRFRPDGFAVYIYGVCSKCQAMLTRQKTKEKKQNNIIKK